MSTTWNIVIVLAAVAGILLCARFFWHPHLNPRSFLRLLFGTLGMFMFASLPTFMFVIALDEGRVECVGRGCRDQVRRE